MSEIVRISRAALHYGEENCISGTRGSGTIFFSGCALGCLFCQNYSVSHEGLGENISVERLADIFKELEAKGAHNINLVTGTHFAKRIVKALDIYKPAIPIVWNCGGYESAETLQVLNGYVDVYLPDYKYCDNELGLKFSKVPDYADKVIPAIAEMLHQVGTPVLDENGMIQKGVIIRHLVLPLHIRNTKQVLTDIKERFPDAWVSVLLQYTPVREIKEYPELNRRLTTREIEKVRNIIYELNFENGYLQEPESATADMIPDFAKLEGVLSGTSER